MKLTNFTNNHFKLWHAAGITGVFITLVVPYFIGISTPHLETAQSLCPFKMLTGFPCPGCGITKALFFLYQGELMRSLSYHVLAIPVILFCVATLVILIIHGITGKWYLRKLFYNSQVAYALGVFLIFYHGIRVIYFIQQHNFQEILTESIWK